MDTGQETQTSSPSVNRFVPVDVMEMAEGKGYSLPLTCIDGKSGYLWQDIIDWLIQEKKVYIKTICSGAAGTYLFDVTWNGNTIISVTYYDYYEMLTQLLRQTLKISKL